MRNAIVIEDNEDNNLLVDYLRASSIWKVLRTISLAEIDSTKLNLEQVDVIFSSLTPETLKEKFDISENGIIIISSDIFAWLAKQEEYNDLRANYNFKTIINSTHNAIIAVNNEGQITLINNSARELLGKDIKYIGQPIAEVVPNTRLNKVLATGQKEINELQLIGEKKIMTNRVPVKNEAGEVIGAVAVFRDITEVREMARKVTNLKEIKVILKEIINATQDAISVVDENGRGIMINRAYTEITGLTEEDVIGKPATVDIAEGESMHLQVLETQEPVFEVPLKVGPTGKEVIVNVSPIIVDGELKGSVGVIHDVSEIRKLGKKLSETKKALRMLEAKYTFKDIIGETREIISAINKAKKAAITPATVLLQGESGTGKELFAHAIHNASNRTEEKFIPVNCPAISESLLESELFGYKEGAFTGAKKEGKKGLFEEADRGTIFLDEVGKLDFKSQAKLLRVLQENEIIRVGGTEIIKIDVRVIIATNSNLYQKVREGSFRKDLYYRLNEFPITIPTLRQRKDDIPALVKMLLRCYTQDYGKLVKDITQEALEKLTNYSWPGNVRELENIIGRSIINMERYEYIIKPEHIPPLEDNSKEEESSLFSNSKLDVENKTLDKIVNQTERQAIITALEKSDGHKKQAAALLDISVRSLYYKLDKFELDY
ncbi:sigma-54 interaction domain-containing protein [Halanaerobaculum tunisiense]